MTYNRRRYAPRAVTSSSTVSVALDAELYGKFAEVAAELDLTKAELVRKMIAVACRRPDLVKDLLIAH